MTTAGTAAYRVYDEGQEHEYFSRWEEAEAAYGRVLAIADAPPSLKSGAWFRLGRCFEETLGLEYAIDAYTQSFSLAEVWPEQYAQMLYRLGNALQKVGAYHDSVRRLESLSALLPIRGVVEDEARELLCKSRELAGHSTPAEPESPASPLSREVQEFLGRMEHARNKLSWHIPPEVLRGARVLDIGCGTGAGVLAAVDLGAALALGIDRSLKEFGNSPYAQVALSKGFSTAQGLLIEGNVLENSFGQPGFDVVTMLDVIEHVPDPAQFILVAYRALTPGGLLLIDTCPLYYSAIGHHAWQLAPKEEAPWFHLYYDAGERMDALNLTQWHRSRIDELNRVTHSQIKNALLQAGFAIEVEHENPPSPEDQALYARFRHKIDHSLLPDAGDLFRDWTLFVARK